MARPKKQLPNKAAQAKHDARLKARREAQREKRTLELASKAAEGQADFAVLVEAEKSRLETRAQTNARIGGSASPKNMVQARENLSLAFDLIGGVPALVVWGRENPTEFFRIWARLIPKEAAESPNQLPLETLLEKLASREGQTVGQAALAIGQETLEAGRIGMMAEDLASKETIQ